MVLLGVVVLAESCLVNSGRMCVDASRLPAGTTCVTTERASNGDFIIKAWGERALALKGGELSVTAGSGQDGGRG